MALYYAFYDSTEDKGLSAAWALKLKYGSSITFKDTTGQNAATITGYVNALTDDVYTDVFVLVDAAATHAAGNFLWDDVALLRKKMLPANKGTTVVVSAACQANATVTEIILPVGSSSVNDFYNEMYIVTAGVTAVYRQIKDYVGATVTATTNTTTTAITNTETCIVYTATNVHAVGTLSTTTGKSVSEQVWDIIMPDTEIPRLLHLTSLYRYAADYGTASAADATTATLAATAGAGALPTRANDVYNGMYIYIYSATTNAGSWAGLTDYVQSTKVATLDATGWVGGTPATSIVYRVMPDTSELFFDNYVSLFTKTYFNDLTSSAQQAEFTKLIDVNNKFNATYTPKVLDQDLDLLADYIKLGKAIFDYNNL